MARTVVIERLGRIEPEPVEVKVLDPIRDIGGEIVPRALRAGLVEVEARSPLVAVVVVEIVAAELFEAIADAHMVVDHVEDHPEPQPMGRIDEGAHVVGRAIGRVRRIEQHAVITPAGLGLEARHRQELDERDAQFRQPRQLPDGALPGAFRREGADMELVDHLVGPGHARPVLVGPLEARVQHFGEPVDAIGLPARGRIVQHLAAIQAIAVAGAGPASSRRTPK